MEAYKKEFIEFMIDCDVLKFGDFTAQEPSCAVLANITQRLSRIPSVWILTFCLDRPTREFP